MPQFPPGNQLAAKPETRWTEAQIRSYQARIRPMVERIGPARLAATTGYSESYIRAQAGYYERLQQPAARFVQALDRAAFLDFIRETAVPFLKEREGQGPRPATWSRTRVRATQKRGRQVCYSHQKTQRK